MKTRAIKTVDLILCAMFIALISIGSYIRIPIPVIPFTLQLMFVMLTGQILKWKYAGITLLVYTALGLLGLPVFSGGGGIGYVFRPSFGYIIGFFFGSMLIAFLSHRSANPTYITLLLSNFAGFFLVYTFGVGYYYLLNTFYFGKYVSLWPMFLSCVVVFLPSDITFCFLTALASKRLRPVLKRFDK